MFGRSTVPDATRSGGGGVNYSVSTVVVSTGDVIRQYTISLSPSHTPWEEFDLSGSVHACEEINFTLSLVGDCRVIHTTTVLPACEYDVTLIMYLLRFPCYIHMYINNVCIDPEELNVGVYFSVDLSLKKIEIVFTVRLEKTYDNVAIIQCSGLQSPNLCPTQIAYYILTFTKQGEDIT